MGRRGVTPYRYVQLARYLFQRWVDQGPAAAASAMRSTLWKGKGRAQQVAGSAMLGHRVALAGMDERDSQTLLRMSINIEAERRGERGSSGPAGGPSPRGRQESGSQKAGPSRLISEKRSVLEPDPRAPPLPQEMYRLMNDERLFVRGAAKPPRELIVLCHGLYGFSTATPIPLFPSLKLHYWASVLEVLRDRLGAKVLVVGVKGTGSIKERAEQMHEFLKEKLPRGTGVNFVAHSMGGLDCRHLISNIKPTTYTPLSLTTIGTPHRGSPFMDWCAANIGVGTAAAAAAAAATAQAASKAAPAKLLPYSLKSPLLSRPPQDSDRKKDESGIGAWTAGLTSYLLNIFDSPAYSNLTTSYLRDHFNPATPDSANVKYTSVAGRCAKMSVVHPLWFTKLVLDAAAENGYANDGRVEGTPYEGNDGLVDVTSAKWGEFLGAVDQTHHWDLRGEGGLFPQPGSIRTSGDSEGSLFGNLQMPGSWEAGGLSEHLGLASSEAKAMADSAVAKASAAIGNPFGSVPNSSQPSASRNGSSGQSSNSPSELRPPSPPSSSNWDVAQVGQVIDWVTDLFPGDNKAAETSKKQLADAQKEKDKAEWREREIQSFVTGDGAEAHRGEQQAAQSRKNKGSKFDLARFYGGLMLKLRDDGF